MTRAVVQNHNGAGNTTVKIQLKHQHSHPVSPDPVVHGFRCKRKSCRCLCGEQYCFKDHELTQPRLGDMELRRGGTPNWNLNFGSRPTEIALFPSLSPNLSKEKLNQFHRVVELYEYNNFTYGILDWFGLVRVIQGHKVGYTKTENEIQLTPGKS
jgi:hypothetical protein